MNFATKDRFLLNLLTYRKVGQNSITIIKGIILTQLFWNCLQTKVKEEQEKFDD